MYDFSRRGMLFKYLIQSVIAYEVERLGEKGWVRKNNVGLCEVDF